MQEDSWLFQPLVTYPKKPLPIPNKSTYEKPIPSLLFLLVALNKVHVLPGPNEFTFFLALLKGKKKEGTRWRRVNG